MFDMCKAIPIHGIKFSSPFYIPMQINNNSTNNFIFLNYKDFKFLPNLNDFSDVDKINDCDSIVIFGTQSHNTFEIINIKILLSMFYFADRLSNSNIKNTKSELSFFRDCTVHGYFNKYDSITDYIWHIKLGNTPLCNDDFDQHITKIFSCFLCDEETRQAYFTPNSTTINITEEFLHNVSLLLNKINIPNQYSNKLKSALRLFYDTLYIKDFDSTILTYSMILETLLLSKNEDNQRKRVSVRSACIIANNNNIEAKKYIASLVYSFYEYRNKIVHDGQFSLDLADDVFLSYMLNSIRHIIYYIIKYILLMNVSSISELKNLVTENKEHDGLHNAFDYISQGEFNFYDIFDFL